MNQFLVKRILAKMGIVAHKKLNWKRLFWKHHIDLVIDVGANTGQTYDWVRDEGFTGPVISFEPCSENFEKLKKHRGYNWRKFQMALSDKPCTKDLYVPSNMEAPSFCMPNDSAVQVERVAVATLDSIMSAEPSDRAFLKIDVEGHLHQVLGGATDSLPRCPLLMVETNLTNHYNDEPLMQDDIRLLESLGYVAIHAETVYSDADGKSAVFDMVLEGKKS